jgi:hypothetical protein
MDTIYLIQNKSTKIYGTYMDKILVLDGTNLHIHPVSKKLQVTIFKITIRNWSIKLTPDESTRKGAKEAQLQERFFLIN